MSEETSDEADKPSTSGEAVEGKARRGALFVLLGYGGSQVLRLIGNLILTRLLFQDAFGIMGLIQVVLMGLELFSDVGIGPSLIQNDRRDRAFVNTAWTMQVGRGGFLYVIACALAYPMASYYEEATLVYLLPLVGLNALAGGFNSTRVFTLNRDLALGRIEIMVFGSQLLGQIVMVTWALISPSVMALVAGSLTTAFSRTLMTHFYLPGEKNRLSWDKSAVTELVRFGRWIFLGTVLTFVAGQSDRLIFGKMVTFEELGVYSVGLVIAMMPVEALGKLTTQIIFPVYSKVRERDGDFHGIFESTRSSLLIAAGWAFAGLIAGGPTAIGLLYDPSYAAAGWQVQILAIGGWWLILARTYEAALFAAGVPKWNSLASFGKIIAMAGFIPLGYWLGERAGGYGFHGAIAGFAASEIARYFIAAASSKRIGMSGFAQDFRLSSLVALSSGVGAVVEYFMRIWEWNILVRCALVAVSVTVFWAPLAWPILRDRLRARREARA
ncbi:MAG: O-antigen/teichoic acid export membrane protein [Polyangiales bacterium]